jgi:hypothetical protein
VRPGLEALKRAAEEKQFDAVLVDDSSRLSRDNQYFNTLLCLFQYWGVSLISVSDGLDMREERAKVAYQFRGIINELYLTDLKKKTHRGQMGQIALVSGKGSGYYCCANAMRQQGGIRTLGTVARTHDFQSCTFGHSLAAPTRRARPVGPARGLPPPSVGLGAVLARARPPDRPSVG